MNKVFAVACVLITFSVASAQMPQPGRNRSMMQDSGKGMMCPMMGSGISMVAGPDGGVFVLAGNKLMKYDSNLSLKKEVEIKADLGKYMSEMMKSCQMMSGGRADTTGQKKK